VIGNVTFVAKKKTGLIVTFSAAFTHSTARIKKKILSVKIFYFTMQRFNLPVKASPTLLKNHFSHLGVSAVRMVTLELDKEIIVHTV